MNRPTEHYYDFACYFNRFSAFISQLTPTTKSTDPSCICTSKAMIPFSYRLLMQFARFSVTRENSRSTSFRRPGSISMRNMGWKEVYCLCKLLRALINIYWQPKQFQGWRRMVWISASVEHAPAEGFSGIAKYNRNDLRRFCDQNKTKGKLWDTLGNRKLGDRTLPLVFLQ